MFENEKRLKVLVDLAVGEFSLLQHPFYQAWQRGQLSRDDLKTYAKEYYHLESALPRLVSRVHSSMESPDGRLEMLKNLISEEGEAKTHRQLWIQFGKGLGVSGEEMAAHQPSEATRAGVKMLMELCAQSSGSGLAALYAYESQQPKIAQTKREGLIQNYGFSFKDDGLEFFNVHEEADVWHSGAEQRLMASYAASPVKEEEVVDSARKAAQALWKFLDGVCAQIGLKCEPEMACSLN